MEEVIEEYPCYFVQKISHAGTLFLYQKRIVFKYADGSEENATSISYSSITNVKASSMLVNSVNSLIVSTKDTDFTFTSLQDREEICSLIQLMKSLSNDTSKSFGFTSDESSGFPTLENPVLLGSYTLDLPLSRVRELVIDSDEIILDLYKEIGNENMNPSGWEHNLKTLSYNKCVAIPVLGKQMIPVKEFKHLYERDNGLYIYITTDLGTTPYADCFDTFVLMHFKDDNGKTVVTVENDIVWSKTPFVKSIVETSTISEVRAQYDRLFEIVVERTGGSTAQHANQPVPSDDKFAKTRRMYKIIIIVLFCVLALVILWREWPAGGISLTLPVLSIILFVLCLIYN